jgi:hypothetical protein
MFSRLRMSVDDAAEEFHRICNAVYVDGLSAVERTRRLRKTIEELLTRRGFPVDLKLGRDARVAEDGCPWYALMVSVNDLMPIQLQLRHCCTHGQHRGQSQATQLSYSHRTSLGYHRRRSHSRHLCHSAKLSSHFRRSHTQ